MVRVLTLHVAVNRLANTLERVSQMCHARRRHHWLTIPCRRRAYRPATREWKNGATATLEAHRSVPVPVKMKGAVDFFGTVTEPVAIRWRTEEAPCDARSGSGPDPKPREAGQKQ